MSKEESPARKVARIQAACMEDPNEHYDPETVLWLIDLLKQAQVEAVMLQWEKDNPGLEILCPTPPTPKI